MAETFSSTTTTKTIAIIGGGLSGALVAANLLRAAHQTSLRVVLVERHLPAGRGVAYRSRCPDHLLNVPASRMSVWPDEPDHFTRWLAEHGGEPGMPKEVVPADFIPRWIYGTYVCHVLAEVRANASRQIEFEEWDGEVMDLEELPEGGGLLHFSDGRTLNADQVVIAVGNLPGEYPIPRPLPVYHSSRYAHVAWRPNALDGISEDDEVLLIGQGLTAADVIVQLDRRGHRGTIHALSRHGLQLQVHRPTEPYRSFLADEPPPATVRELVRRVRAEVRSAAAVGVDWRSVIDGLRPHAQTVWQTLSWDERARFLRHVRPFWEIHRHRLPPQVAAVLDRMVVAGRLKFCAGRLQVLEANSTGAQALFRRRGTIHCVSLNVAKVINCTGPRTDYSKYQHPLFIHLLARGLIDHDPLALGINALPTGEVLRYRGAPLGWLHTLGPPLKGVLWETTSVPEIRTQAKVLAERLLRTADESRAAPTVARPWV
jgi:uncharacterized NAD(P)/FAD-binding protein YdhS